jgi:hypothetical protein
MLERSEHFFYGNCNLVQKSKQEDSRFNYHKHWRIHSICFACKADDKILFYYIYFFKKKLFLLLICITNKYFLLQATTLGHE